MEGGRERWKEEERKPENLNSYSEKNTNFLN